MTGKDGWPELNICLTFSSKGMKQASQYQKEKKKKKTQKISYQC